MYNTIVCIIKKGGGALLYNVQFGLGFIDEYNVYLYCIITTRDIYNKSYVHHIVCTPMFYI